MSDWVEDGRVNDDMKRAVEGIRNKFVDGGEQRILLIEAALSEIREGHDCLDAARRLSIEVHSIAGIAPTLGFMSMGKAASNAEQLWEQAIDQKFAKRSLQTAVSATEFLLDEIETLLEPILT